jgi:hypothetical protein
LTNLTNIQTLFDAILVNGYGSKPAAGWSKPFSASSIAIVYRNGPGAKARSYFRILSGANDRLEGYDAMTNSDTGTNSFGKNGSTLWGTNAIGYLDSSSISSWLAIADERTLFFRYVSGSTYLSFYLGDIQSFTDPDEGCAFILSGQEQPGTIGYGVPWLGGIQTTYPGQNKGALKGFPNYNGNELYGMIYPSPMFISPLDTYYTTPVSAVDNRMYVAPLWVLHSSANNFSNPVLRGRIRWLYLCMGPESNYTDGTVVNGMGQLAGRQLTLLKLAHAHSSVTTHFFVAADLND